MRIRINADLFQSAGFLGCQRIKFSDTLQLVAKKRKPPAAVIKVGRPELKAVPPHPKATALKCLIIAFILLGNKVGHDLALVITFTDQQILGHRAVSLYRANPVDTAHRGNDDHIIPLKQSPGSRVPHPVDLFVDLRFFFDECIRARHIGLGLVVIIKAHKILDRILRKKALHLAI